MVANCLKTAVEPQKTRNSIRQSTDLSPMISRILCQDSMPRPRRDWTETTKADKKKDAHLHSENWRQFQTLTK